jgi:TatD DNase family protein
VIHTRAAESQTLDQLAAEAGGISVVMHCFSMPDQLQECVDRGYAISFAGNVTYRSASDLAAAAARVPEDRLLVETDAPYLSPAPVRRERNQPAFVVHTLAFLAELRGVAARELGATVERNAARLFGWA